MIQLFGHPVSTCTRKVLTTLAELGLPHEMQVIDFATGEHKQAANLKRQPFGQVPAINDDGFMLFESRAICRYLNNKAKGALAPTDIQKLARMDQWLSVDQANFAPAAMKFIFQYVFKRPQEQAALDSAQVMLETCLATMSEDLQNHDYLAGEQFTLADIGFMPYVGYLVGTPVVDTLKKYPAVMAWWERVSARPSWQKVAG
jgi:glutathione S-transferase